MTTKIAAVTEDGTRLSSHFGMAPAYIVYTIEGERIVSEERREKPHHKVHPEHGHGEGHHAGGHHHADMFAPVADCQVLLCGGMGTPAYQKALAAGLEVVLTGGELRTAVQAYIEGRLESDMRRVHAH